ncbi:MAG: TIGR00282 family metallophosphoesterase [Ruminococcaceae bacterium]|nr:TIGR00282 family metallophosphoesterase [Oscillospiraceae bacterium]
MNVLCIGDVTGEIGCRYLRKVLPDLKRELKADVVIVNGENSADGNGVTPYSADSLFASGADVITGGNHSLRRREVFERLDSDPFLLRPQNISENAPGKGYCVLDLGRTKIAVINLVGKVYMPDAADPFSIAEELIEKAKADSIKYIMIDFHAEATAEKMALGYFVDGKVSAVFGTHTHVLTADCKILPDGTGFITDIGFTGPVDSVLGVKKELSLARIKDGTPVKFTLADSKCALNGILFELDDKTGLCKGVKTVVTQET